jgi:hypothetical protein
VESGELHITLHGTLQMEGYQDGDFLMEYYELIAQVM